MTVIKRAHAEVASKSAIVLDLGDIAQHAELLRKQAQDRADQIIIDAENKRDELIAEGYEQGERNGQAMGYREGLAKGEEAGRQRSTVEARDQLDQIEIAWNAALDDFADRRHHLLVEGKENVIRLALTIAERVIHRTIEVDERVVMAQVEHALKLIGRPTRATVLVHPDDAAMVRRALPTVSARFGAIEHVVCEEDDSVGRGGCKVATAEGGEIDASIETQIERIAQTLIPSNTPKTEQDDQKREDKAA
jgi:flagellar assembly protein FliH